MLKERIDATEALITIHLDSRRNDLVAFDLVGFSSPCKRPAFRRGDLEGCCLLLELSFTLLLYNRGQLMRSMGQIFFFSHCRRLI